MNTKTTDLQAECERLRLEVADLKAQLATALALIDDLKNQLAVATKNSTNSSKRPSSDIVKPKPTNADGSTTKRSIGAQPGHPMHERQPFPPEQVTASFEHRIANCPHCGDTLRPLISIEPRVVQQVDILDVPLRIEEHQAFPGWCAVCQQTHYAAMPIAIEKGGLVGPKLTALIAYLKGVCHASYSTIRLFLRDVVRVTISRGQLARVIAKVSEALEMPYQELLDSLPGEAVLNVDETRHKDNGQYLWTWCFRAELYTLFKIDPTRSSDVLIETLGEEFAGVLGCDFFSAYRCYARQFDVKLQFCLAHLIRDVKFFLTLPKAEDRVYGERFRDALRELFGVIHRRETMSASAFESALAKQRDEVLRVGRAGPDTPNGRRMSKRMREHGEGYFRFITTAGMEPTNNVAEQAIRFVVIDRLITQGTRSDGGQRWCERIWTVIATCANRGLSVFDYLSRAVAAYFQGTSSPSLLPAVG
jgi:transposase